MQIMGTLKLPPLYDRGKSRQYSVNCRAVVDKSGVNICIYPLLTFPRFSFYICMSSTVLKLWCFLYLFLCFSMVNLKCVATCNTHVFITENYLDTAGACSFDCLRSVNNSTRGEWTSCKTIRKLLSRQISLIDENSRNNQVKRHVFDVTGIKKAN
jgi:hypothetical protein